VQLVRAMLLRLLYGGLSLLFISVVTFMAGAFSPSDAATLQAGEKASAADVAMLRHQMGLDRPWPIRYVEYVEHALHGDLGNSLMGTKEPVKKILVRCVPITAEIALISICVAAIVGISVGVVSSVYRNKGPDRVALTLSTLGVTIPNFVLAPILVYIFAIKLNRLPTNWRLDRPEGDFYYLLLPVTILAARPAAVIMRLTRASMIETLQQEFIRTAIAKGVPRFRLYTRHALRNAILPVVTAIGTNFGFLLTGSFVIDRAFTIPGIGSRTIEAIISNDMPVVQACVLVTGAMFILLNTLIDMALPFIDPRIRESQI
jgi:ABC-type dipeptide/oligopeptide/nickel transport system permease component